MARNTLFLAVTRPALFAGIPIEAAVVILLTSVITLIGTTNLFTALSSRR
jgi:type IV secretion system protein VirB3